MTEIVTTEVTTEVTVTAETPVAAAPVQKEPSKKSRAVAIFKAKLADRANGLFDSNKAFRKAVLDTIQAELGVSTASAATMYNSAKVEAETADPEVKLGRDPKKEKVAKGTGKRGRPLGSKNKPKAPAVEVAAPAELIVPEVTAEVAPEAAAEATPEAVA